MEEVMKSWPHERDVNGNVIWDKEENFFDYIDENFMRSTEIDLIDKQVL